MEIFKKSRTLYKFWTMSVLQNPVQFIAAPLLRWYARNWIGKTNWYELRSIKRSCELPNDFPLFFCSVFLSFHTPEGICFNLQNVSNMNILPSGYYARHNASLLVDCRTFFRKIRKPEFLKTRIALEVFVFSF